MRIWFEVDWLVYEGSAESKRIFSTTASPDESYPTDYFGKRTHYVMSLPDNEAANLLALNLPGLTILGAE